MVSLAAEFPNDNPALHGGASWVCLELTGPAVAVREERPRLAPPEPVAVAPVMATEPEPEPEPIAVAIVFEPAAALIEVAASANVDLDPVEEPAPVPEARISCVVPVGHDHAMDDEDDAEDEIVVEELPPLDETASVEGAVVAESVALPAASDDPFTVLLTRSSTWRSAPARLTSRRCCPRFSSRAASSTG